MPTTPSHSQRHYFHAGSAQTAALQRTHAAALTPPLVNFLPAGVYDALDKKYLRKVFFGFSRDKEGKELLEEVR